MDRFCGYLWRAAPYVHINPMFISFERVQTNLNKYQIQGGKPLHGTITISGAKNAAVLAAQILAVSDDALAAKLDQAREDMARQIADKEAKLQEELGK